MPLVKIERRGKRPRHSKFFWVYRGKQYGDYQIYPTRNFCNLLRTFCQGEYHRVTGFRQKPGQWVKMHLVKY